MGSIAAQCHTQRYQPGDHYVLGRDMRKKRESGQAIILVVLAVGLLLMGSLGLAIDAGTLYGHRQMAQVAADAAAEAGILSIFGGTNTGANAFGDAPFTCTVGTDARSPCAYARLN